MRFTRAQPQYLHPPVVLVSGFAGARYTFFNTIVNRGKMKHHTPNAYATIGWLACNPQFPLFHFVQFNIIHNLEFIDLDCIAIHHFSSDAIRWNVPKPSQKLKATMD